MLPRKRKSSDSQSFRGNSLEKTERRFTYKPMKRVEETYWRDEMEAKSQTQNRDRIHHSKIQYPEEQANPQKPFHQIRTTFIQQLKKHREKHKTH